MKQLFTLIIFISWSSTVFAQEAPEKKALPSSLDSLPIATNNIVAPPDTILKATGWLPILFPKLWDGKKRFTGPFPIPKKALVMAVAIPGGGQIYNKKFWKLPIVYGVYGLLGYSLYNNTKEFKRYKKGYLAKLNKLPDDEFPELDAGVLLDLRNKHRKSVQLSAIGLVVGHLLIGVDAFVDAHLYHFNVDEDLSMGVGPSFQYTVNQQFAPGIQLNLFLRQDKLVINKFY